MEDFQNVFDKMFFRVPYFKDFAYLCQQAKDIEIFHNQNHHYNTIRGMNPNQKFKDKMVLLPASFLWELFAEWSFINGYRKNDIVNLMIEKI